MIPIRILICGDTHGQSRYLRQKAALAKQLGADRIMVVGDFGMWPGHGGVRFLDEVNEAAREHSILIYALPGNHEDHDQWEKWLNMGMPKDSAKFTYIRSNLLISPKIHNWAWDKKRFFIVGGAVSIDRKWRRSGETWWEGETLTASEIASVEKYSGPDIDYLFTHDCSDHTPWGFDLVPDHESKAHRQYIDRAIKALRPGTHWHGHMHHRYNWENTYSHGQRKAFGQVDNSEWNGKTTLTFGLDCNDEEYSWGILDTTRNQFFWPHGAFEAFDNIMHLES